MRLAHLLLVTSSLVTFTYATEALSLYAAIKLLPPCGLSCVTRGIVQSPCQPTDGKCICTNSDLLHHVESCVLVSCTIKESLVTKNITSRACDIPIRDKAEKTRLPNIILSTLTATIGLSRLTYSAVFSPHGWALDDYCLLAVLIAGAPSVTIIDRMSIPNGLGKDVWNIPFSNIITFVRSVYALEILYFLQIVLVKATLLFFFLKIFPKQTTRRLIKYTLVFNALYGLSFTIIAIFPCQPISYYWTRFTGERTGRCIDINALVWANAGISILQDLWMLALPLYEVFRLQMSWHKRISVSLMFFVGTFVTIVSIIRLRFLVTFARGNNPTWDQSDVVNWSNIEINVGILCACMPTIRVMIVRISPNLLSSTRGRSVPSGERCPERSMESGRKDLSVDSEFGLTYNESVKELERIPTCTKETSLP